MPRPPDHLQHVDDSPPAAGLVGDSDIMKRLFQLLRLTAGSDQPVLISREVGTGKTQIATVLHQLSDRNDGPFFRVNCAAINDQQLVEELLDWFHEAHGGVLFFDEIKSIHALHDGSDGSDDARHFNGLSLSFNHQEQTHPMELELVEQYGWPVAANEGWPGGFAICAGKPTPPSILTDACALANCRTR